MKPRALIPFVFSTFAMTLSGCFEEPTCPYGEVLVHDGRYGSDGVCMRRSYYTTPTATSTPAIDAGSKTPAPAAATPASGAGGSDPSSSGGDSTPVATPTPAVVPGTCGGLTAQSDTVRVVEKSDLSPALGDAPPNLADGSYALVQATFFRSGATVPPVRKMRATLDVKGPTLTVNAQDSSVPGLPHESLTFLQGSATSSMVTKTCESVHGSVSAWFFPFVVGTSSQTQMQYDGQSGLIRIIVSRGDGATELVFGR